VTLRIHPYIFAPGFAALVTVASAGPVESAIVAAMKLPDAPSYAWRTEVADDARTYEISGSTERAGEYSLVTMPIPVTGGRRAARGPVNSSGTSTVTAWFKGAVDCVVQSGDGWRRPEEMSNAGDRDAGGGGGQRRRGGGGPPGGGGGIFGGGMGGRGVGGGGRGGGYPPPVDDRGEAGGRAFSNVQKTLSRPHEEIAVIVAGGSELKAEGEVVSGRLSETSAKLLLVHEGQRDRVPLQAGGTFRLWVRGGALVKYETRLEGVLRVDDSAGRREVRVNETSTTTLSEVGTARVEVPPEVRKRLGG
jgi:hypothetical protein